jgi:hypothetical protein
LEMALVCAEMVAGTVFELEMALGILLETKLIAWVRLFWGDPRCFIWSSPLLPTVLFETDLIAILEKRWADWKYRYHYASDYDVTCHLCSYHH